MLSIEMLPEADITFITTPDHVIESTALRLLQSPNFRADSIMVHCSGALPASILEHDIKPCLTASAHPMHSFADPGKSVATLAGSYCTLEGSNHAVAVLTGLFSQLGCHIAMVTATSRYP